MTIPNGPIPDTTSLTKHIETPPPETTMVALVNDGGEKYMDTVFNDDWMKARDLIDPTVEREIDELLTKLRGN